MMYKVVYDDYVIDLLTKITYIKFLRGTSKRTITDKTNADGIIGSDNKTVYVLQGKIPPEGTNYKVVSLHSISEAEYNELNELRALTPAVIIANPNSLRAIREEKIAELSNVCHEKIVAGVSVLLSDNFYHHFALSLEDQVNLLNIEQQLRNGAKNILYHETGCLSQIYSAKDMKKILTEVRSHIEWHQLHFNLLKYCINNMYSIELIDNIEYNQDINKLILPEKIKEAIRELTNE